MALAVAVAPKYVDEQGNVLADVDLEKGSTAAGKLFVQHHDAVQAQEAVYEDVLIETYENGGELYNHVLKTPAVEGVDAWDEYEDVLIYTPYTDEELAQQQKEKEEQEAAQKKAQEEAKEAAKKQEAREQFLDSAPERVTKLESSQLDTDEAITSLYEALTAATSATE